MRPDLAVLPWIATILLYVSVVVYTIGYGSPFWFQRSEFPEAHGGIWVSCAVVNDTGEYQWFCYDSKDFVVDGM
jgi:hypothetical protein